MSDQDRTSVLRVGRAEVGRVSHMGFTEQRRRLLLLLRAGIGYPRSPTAN